MPIPMERRDHYVPVTIANAANLSGAFDFRHYAALVVHMPGTWTAASIGFKVSSSEAGTFLPLYDDNGALVQIDAPTASKAYTAPADLMGARWVKLWSQDGAAANTNQGAERVLSLDMKS